MQNFHLKKINLYCCCSHSLLYHAMLGNVALLCGFQTRLLASVLQAEVQATVSRTPRVVCSRQQQVRSAHEWSPVPLFISACIRGLICNGVTLESAEIDVSNGENRCCACMMHCCYKPYGHFTALNPRLVAHKTSLICLLVHALDPALLMSLVSE